MIDVHALGFVTVIKGGRTTDAYTSRPLYDDDDVCVCVCVCTGRSGGFLQDRQWSA